jgi:hypothetical protein
MASIYVALLMLYQLKYMNGEAYENLLRALL